MFKNIQKQLLLKYPLLWNTKFIPMLVIGVVMNLIYFFIGYYDGTLNFKENYSSQFDFTFYSFSVLISLIILIIWLVNYFKNNSFKSFYSKSKSALFYEWLQIVVIVLLLSMFYFPFELGKKAHKRSYFSEIEAKKRCEAISKADFFIDGNYEEPKIDSINSVFNDTTINGQYKAINIIRFNYVIIEGKKFAPNSLINRNVGEFSFFTREQDSLRKLKLRKDLIANKDFVVKKIMKAYLTILKDHKLETNLNEKLWFSIVYDHPKFQNYKFIGTKLPKNVNYYDNQIQFEDEYNSNVATIYNKSYSQYYIQRDILVDNYNEISLAFTESVFKTDGVLVFLYIVLGISMLIFSFRITSGKSWLIALVGFGIFNIVLGIIAATSRSDYAYPVLITLVFLVIVGYFVNIVIAKKTKGRTMVFINLILWLFGGFLPTVYLTYFEYYKDTLVLGAHTGYDDYPHYVFLKDNLTTMFGLNIVLIIIVVFFISKLIRTWKGISEE